MHGTFGTRPDGAALDLSRIDWEIAVISDPEPDLVAHYRATCWDRETGIIIGSFTVPPGWNGEPPTITVGDVVEWIGGYRIASIFVAIEVERLATINRRCSDRSRSRARAWLRTAPRSALTEHGIDQPHAGGRR